MDGVIGAISNSKTPVTFSSQKKRVARDMMKQVARAMEYARAELVTCTTASKQLTSLVEVSSGRHETLKPVSVDQVVDRVIQRITANQTN